MQVEKRSIFFLRPSVRKHSISVTASGYGSDFSYPFLFIICCFRFIKYHSFYLYRFLGLPIIVNLNLNKKNLISKSMQVIKKKEEESVEKHLVKLKSKSKLSQSICNISTQFPKPSIPKGFIILTRALYK